MAHLASVASFTLSYLATTLPACGESDWDGAAAPSLMWSTCAHFVLGEVGPDESSKGSMRALCDCLVASC